MTWPWNWGRGGSRSLKMAPFDRSHTTFYWSAIVNRPTALSCTVFALFDIEWYHDLEIWVRGHSRSFMFFIMCPCLWIFVFYFNSAERWIKLYIQTGTIRKLGCGFLFAFHSNYGSILHHLRDKARYWSKIMIFHTPFHSAPPLGGPRRNIAIPFGMEKLEWLGVRDGEKNFRICITKKYSSTQPENYT